MRSVCSSSSTAGWAPDCCSGSGRYYKIPTSTRHRNLSTLQPTDELSLLAIQAATRFELTDSGRMQHENTPDRSPAPRLWLAGCASGNIVRMREDLREDTARAIEALVAREPPMRDFQSMPAHLDECIKLLAAEGPVEQVGQGVVYSFPDTLRYEHRMTLVTSGTPEGDSLIAHLNSEGMPPKLVEVGFVDVTHLWPPWCIARHESGIVSIAFAARLSMLGAEVGVTTLPEFRGHGFAAAVTAGWASLPSLRDRALFYSTKLTNVSSQRVADRLGLRLLGPSLTIS